MKNRLLLAKCPRNEKKEQNQVLLGFAVAKTKDKEGMLHPFL
jgi:hypothetical protein